MAVEASELRELDVKVAEAMGIEVDRDVNGEPYHKGAILANVVIRWVSHYSADIADAWVAWEWLEENHPWELISLHRDTETGKPCVAVVDYMPKGLEDTGQLKQFRFQGETYPHAICLAVIEAGKQK